MTCPLIRRELVTGMAQVVKVNRREPGRPQRRMPDATAEVAAPQRAARRTGEHEPVITGCGEGHDVRGKIRGDHRRNSHDPVTGVRLRRPERAPAAAPLAQLPGNPDDARLEVDVRPAQPGQLTPAQAAENGEQHQRTVPATDRIGQGVDLGNGQDRPLG
jgi:hypothetical protein